MSQILYVTAVGGTNYSYDDNGNLTNDGSFSYSYDCENRLERVEGVESVGCGDFSCTTGWEFDNYGNCWSISDGNATFEGDHGNWETLYQNITLEAGKTYRVKFTITEWIDDYDEEPSSLWIYFGIIGVGNGIQTISVEDEDYGVREHSYDVTVGAGISGRINFDASAGTESESCTYIELDDVSVVEIP